MRAGHRWWRTKSARAKLLGIDLQPSEARLVGLGRAGSAWWVDQCRVQPLPPGACEAGRLLQFEPMVRALRSLCEGAGERRPIALALPASMRTQALVMPPADLRPWAWRRWWQAQAEALAQAPADALVWELEPVGTQCRLTVCERDALEDWLGLAEAAGLALALVDEVHRVAVLALRSLCLRDSVSVGSSPLACIAWADESGCLLVTARRDEPPRPWPSAADDPPLTLPQGGWVVGEEAACAAWAPVLEQASGAPWPVLRSLPGLNWREGLERPAHEASLLVALGLSLRAFAP